MNRVQISHARLERAFEQYIDKKYDDFTETETDVNVAENMIDNAAEINTISAEFGNIERKTEEIMGLFVSNKIDFDTYQGMVKVINQRRVELDARLTILQNSETAKGIRYDRQEIMDNFRANWRTLGGTL